ncbi:MAG: nucleoside hydrolase [Acidimicrobiia bacterium]
MRTTAARTSGMVLLALAAAACTPGRADISTPGPEGPAASSTLTTDPPPATTTSQAPTDDRRPVILDYSPTVSDLGALALLAAHPDIRLIAVTLPGTGESYCEPGVAHTRGVLVQLDQKDIPVACGPDDPLSGWNAFPTSWRIASNEMELPIAEPNETRSAPDLIVDLVRSSDVPVEIVAVGPLTNVAIALQSAPDMTSNVAGITIMGGAVDIAGNVFRNEVAEWNIWVDPTAAGVVLASGAPVTLVPLNATNHTPTGRIFYDALLAAESTPESSLVSGIWRAAEEQVTNPDGFWFFWDELAAAVLVDSSIVSFETRTLVVDDDLRENKGWTREDPSGTAVRVAVSSNRLAFETLFLETLVGGPVDLGYLEATPAEITYLTEVAAIADETQVAIDDLFEAAAADIDPSQDDDEGFFLLLLTILSQAVDGPLAEQLMGLAALDVPPSLAENHRQYLAALSGLIDSRDEMMAVLEADGTIDAFEQFLEPSTEACLAIQREADVRLLDIDAMCF